MFAAEICKFKTNGCSANCALLKTGSTGEDENRRTELQTAVTGMKHISPNTVG